MAVEPGAILQGRYRLDALIGRGGMGRVFSATDLQTGAEVAIKIVSRLYVDDTVMGRLHREAEAAARIRSDYVPRVFEVSDTDERELFLVMERLHGESLSQTIRERGALPWNEVQHVAEDVLRALIDAHTAGIVHRDLKPSNVFISDNGGRVRAFVLDFGVCKMDGVDHERLTGTGEAIGTVAYMAPEQIRGAAKVDDRADLYAFGALVFEMLTGRLPHEGPSQMAILASKLEKPADRLAEHVLVEIPAGLDDLVARTLARDPQERPASAQDLLKAWRGLSNEMCAPSSPAMLDDEHPSRRGGRALDEPPTEMARPAGPAGPTMVVSPGATGPMPVARPASAPIAFEPHLMTQTSLTTGFGGRVDPQRRGTRMAVALAACGMVAGLVVVGVSVARAPAQKASPSANAAPETSAAVQDPVTEAPEEPPGAEEPAITIDLGPTIPDEGASDAGAPAVRRVPRRHVRRPRPTHPSSKPTSTQHITTRPRY